MNHEELKLNGVDEVGLMNSEDAVQASSSTIKNTCDNKAYAQIKTTAKKFIVALLAVSMISLGGVSVSHAALTWRAYCNSQHGFIKRGWEGRAYKDKKKAQKEAREHEKKYGHSAGVL
tara:strand:+ start:1892 stop:2245 length:354 start_codon:yes stop_codon:yes gene_type:complete